ncbi:hypothetical protein DV515_00012983 [Chloebia gouldiae]|uniref:Uncharacterized protein n=1 Tax=Chloebia gouldiae TaxID=44316 RepID=A0A3L8S280_CHLGU|nr:hypothetical protein DV515_00012983 [Chloebia gouldiae]
MFFIIPLSNMGSSLAQLRLAVYGWPGLPPELRRGAELSVLLDHWMPALTESRQGFVRLSVVM